MRTRELPPPLPPAERTVGQLIGETIRAYGANFWRALPLGLPFAVVDQVVIRRSPLVHVVAYGIGSPAFALAFVWACALVLGSRPTWIAYLTALLIWLPFPVLQAGYLLPALAWFGFIGLAVPAAMVDRLGFRRTLERGRRLGQADYVHALGSIAALVLVVAIADQALTSVLHSQGSNSQRVALFLADLVLSPLLYLGGAQLYLDQAARVGSRSRRSRPKE